MKRLTLLAMTASALLTAGGTIAVGSAAATSTLPTLSLTITKSSITVGGTTQSGAVNVVSTATGVKEAGAILFLLKPGATFETVEAAIQKAHGEINVTSEYGSLVFDAEVSSGQASEVQTYLQPGQYVAVVPGEEGKGSKAHANFTVSAAASPVALPAPETRQHLRAGLGQHQHGSWPGTTARTPRSRRWGSGRPARAGRGCLSRWACTGIIAVSATARRLPSPRRPRSGNWVRRARSCARQAPMSVPWRPTGQPASSSSPSGGTCAVALYAGYWRAAWRLSSRTGINGAFRAAGLAVSMIVDHRDRISGI